METHLLDTMLSTYLSEGTPLTIVLQNRSRLSGRIRAFDSYVIVLETPRGEILYRHAVSSIAPAPAQVAEAAKPAAERQQKKKQPEPSAHPSAPHAARRKQERPAPKTAAPAEPVLNTSMKEGLLRWMQEHKTK